MSKIVVDKIQKSGGPELTLPTTSGAANSLIVNDGAGNLSFSDLGNLLPAGGANTVLTNDGSGNLSFDIVSKVLDDTKDIIGMIRSSSAQNNTYSTPAWSSSGPWTTYQNYEVGGNNNSNTQAFNMVFGDGYPNGTTQIFHVNDREGEYQRDLTYAWGNRIGHLKYKNYYDQNDTANYTGKTWSLMPIRNSGSTDTAVTMNGYFSSEFSSYGGIGVGIFVPDGATYSATTTGTWSQLYTSQSTGGQTFTLSMTIPAGKTVLLFGASSHDYQTTNKFFDFHFYYNLQNCFSPTNDIYCDLRMLNTLYMVRAANTYTSIQPQNLYTKCASIFGNR